MDELVKDLRYCASTEEICGECKHSNEVACEVRLLEKAADAIEELSKRLDESIPKGDAEIIIAEVAKSRWIPVTEQLPEDLQNVLVIDDGRVTIGHCERFYGDEQIYVEWHDTLYYPIAPPFWMPLPEPPKEEQDG